MLEKPLLFVDVDGVISLWGFAPDTCPPGVWSRVDGLVHFLSTRAADALLVLSDDYELVWCTGWEERADEHLPTLLGLPRGLPHLSFDRPVGRGPGSRAHWKLDAIDAHAGTRPLAWVDDAVDEECRTWARTRAAPTLLVVTDPAAGLGEPEVALLRAFVEELAAA